MIEQERGAKAVDEAIRVPPSSSEQMFDPLTYLNGDRPVTVDPVKVPAGATVIDQGPFGSVQWFLMLAERIKPATALRPSTAGAATARRRGRRTARSASA